MSLRTHFIFPVVLAVGTIASAVGAPPRALPDGQLPDDWRLQPLKDLNAYFPFQPPETRDAWDKRSEQVRRQMLVALGLWPLPTKTPLGAVVHGKLDLGDYTVEKAYFESYPGFYVTGNLYRPKAAGEPSGRRRPGVLCPHGHWSQGRFYDCGAARVRRDIVEGAERFQQGGRSPLQARCVQLARMGCTVFHYDMIGYADSVQLSFELAHRFARQRPEMNTLENWGLFSPQAELNLQNVMGLQAYNSIRALDFLISLPDVDPQRLAVTGASGGGTQTFIVSAIDPRPAVSMPAVMVSTAMQGGCTCENTCLLRVDTGNIEIAGLFAPKPLGLTAADDWTKEMQTKGFPQLQQLYRLLGSANNVMLKSAVHFKHNYNHVSRAAMYGWLNRHLKLGQQEPIVEQDYRRLTSEEMTVWTAAGDHARPQGGPQFERELLRWITEDTRKQLEQLQPHDRDSWQRYREIVGGALEVLAGRRLPQAGDVSFDETTRKQQGSHTQIVGVTRHRIAQDKCEVLPTVLLVPNQPQGRAVVWVDGAGKSALFAGNGSLRPEMVRLLDAGCEVIGADLLFQGEFLADGQPRKKTRRVKNPREAAAYTFGYNHTLFARRGHDVLTLIALARSRPAIRRVDVCGGAGAGPWVSLALTQVPGAVERAAIHTGGFRFGKLLDIHHVNFLPGGAKYGDLPGIVSLVEVDDLLLAGEDEAGLHVVRSAFTAAGAPQRLHLPADSATPWGTAAVRWLLETSRE